MTQNLFGKPVDDEVCIILVLLSPLFMQYIKTKYLTLITQLISLAFNCTLSAKKKNYTN